MAVFALSVHAQYACRHSGACCTAGWNIPVEPRLRRLLGARLLVPDAHGRCVHFDPSSHLCRVHRDFGEARLPHACRQFPRRTLLDDRGVFVSLSHYCPTAATALVDHVGPLAIVANPPAFPSGWNYEGLDARGAWPPLVRPSVLFDLDGYSRWEAFLVACCADEGSPVRATARMAAAAEHLRAWMPANGTLSDHLAAATAQPADESAVPAFYRDYWDVRSYARVCALVPDGLHRPDASESVRDSLARFVEPAWNDHAPVVNRYLAARGFASWCAYQARGVRTAIAELMVSEMVLRVEAAKACAAVGHPLDRTRLIAAVRAADLLLVHLVDRGAFMRWVGAVESA